MRVQVLTPKELFSLIRSLPRHSSIFVFSYIITEPWASLFAEFSYATIFTSLEKICTSKFSLERIRNRANIYVGRDLHLKGIYIPEYDILIIGSGNFTKRSITRSIDLYIYVSGIGKREREKVVKIINLMYRRSTRFTGNECGTNS